VKIERENDEGEKINVGQLSAYQVFGELAMLSQRAAPGDSYRYERRRVF